MPAEGFLQRFHDLADADEEFRCSTAVSLRESVSARGEGAEAAGSDENELQYALRRLVRGVQSSRQCCRQGFSLALAELLAEFPNELAGVLQLIRQHTGLQSGFRSNELKERLLARLFSYSAILEAGCLSSVASEVPKGGSRKQSISQAAEIGSGLHEIFATRQYLRGPAAHLLAQLCRDLIGSGHTASVPEALAAWTLDAKLDEKEAGKDLEKLDVFAAGLVLDLRLAYEDVERRNEDRNLASWPACVKKNTLAKPPALFALTNAIGRELAVAPLGDIAPSAIASFCQWLLRIANRAAVDDKTFESQVWPVLDKALFPENASASTQAQGLRGLGEIATCLHEAGSKCSGPQTQALFVGFFEQMQRGLTLLFHMLSWQRAHTHAAAVFANARLAQAAGAPPAQAMEPAKKKNKKKTHKNVTSDSGLEMPLEDDARLSILRALQQHKGFGTMKGTFQRQWQQALVLPLSTKGIRIRCSSLLASLVEAMSRMPPKAGEEEDDSVTKMEIDAKVFAEQLVQIATHSHVPDEVILAVLCTLFTAAYFESPAAHGAGYSLRKFCHEVGTEIAVEGDDIIVPALPAKTDGKTESGTAGEADMAHWRVKFWSVLTRVVRSTTPETAEKHSTPAKEEHETRAGQVLKTVAFHGCLSDGSLWLLRLHEWLDHVTTHAPTVLSTTPSSPRQTKRKRRTDGASLKFMATEGGDDVALRKRCVQLCRKLFDQTSAAGKGMLTTRQVNALCALPLSLSLAITQVQEDDERERVMESLTDLLEALEKILSMCTASEAATKKKKFKENTGALAVVPRIACELFVESSGLVKEATRTAWRELGEFISDETVTSLCGSVCDLDEGDDAGSEDNGGDAQEEGEEEDDDDPAEGGAATTREAARIAQFEEAKKRLEKAREDGNDDSDDGDEVMLGGDELMDQLLDDNGDTSFLTSFAASGLEGADASGPKLSKRQKRLRQRQEDLARKFRELELLELFTFRFVEKRPVAIQVLKRLFDALLSAGRRATGGKSGSAEGGAKAPKADAQLRRIESDLARRLADVVAKALKQICRWPILREICKWHSKEEWATQARELVSVGQGALAAAAGPRASEVGAVFLYCLCCMHRASSLGADADLTTGDEAKAERGWMLSQELLTSALQDWSNKRDSERWCGAVFQIFANRAPQVLLQLPWLEQIRESRNSYVQRSQVGIVATQVLRNLPASATSTRAFAARFTVMCADLLEGTLDPSAATYVAASSSQRQKLRRDVLKALSASVRTLQGKRRQPGDSAALPFDDGVADHIVEVLRKIVVSLPAKRGELYQLSLQLQRSLRRAGSRKDGVGEDCKKDGSKKSRPTANEQENNSGVAPAGAAGPVRKKRRSTAKSSFFSEI